MYTKTSNPEIAAEFIRQGFKLDDVYQPLTDQQVKKRQERLEKIQQRPKTLPPLTITRELLSSKLRD